jgi:predicted nucleic acid-binding protein
VPQDPCFPSRSAEVPGIVLDTNAVLALWWFRDPAVAPLARAVEDSAAHWWATAAMRDELLHVLPRLPVRGDERLMGQVLACFDRWADITPQLPGPTRLRCTDPDDQKFLDLALQRKASWLFSRDRAVLRLRRQAAPHGLAIRVPDHWELQPLLR